MYLGGFSQVSNIFINLLLTPFILKHISYADYGLYIVIVGSFQFASIFNFGFGAALETLVSRNNKNTTLVTKYVTIVQAIQLAIGLIVLVIGVNFSYHLDYYYPSANNAFYKYKLAILFISLSFIVLLMKQVYGSLLRAYRKIHINAELTIITNLISALTLYFFLKFNTGILGLTFNFLITQLLLLALTFYNCKINLPNIKYFTFNFEKQPFNDLSKIGLFIFMGSFSILILERLDNILIVKILNLETVTVFVISSKIFDLSKRFIALVSNNFRPYFGEMIENNKHKKRDAFYKVLRRLVIVVSIISATFCVHINPYFIKFWMGSDELYAGTLVTYCLGLNIIYWGWRSPTRAYLTSNLIIKEAAFFSIIEGTAKISASVVLGLKYGLIGIAFGTFISGFFMQFIFYGYILNKYRLESYYQYYKNQLPIVLQLIFFSAVCIITNNALGKMNSLYSVFGLIFFSTFINVTLVYIFNKKQFKFFLNYK